MGHLHRRMVGANMALDCGAIGIGLATFTEEDVVLDCWFPGPRLIRSGGGSTLTELNAATAEKEFGIRIPLGTDPRRPNVSTRAVHVTVDDLRKAPENAFDVYLRLHLISHRLVRPHGANLDGIFALLTNAAWTTDGVMPVAAVAAAQLRARAERRHFEVICIDKIPRMVDYVVPEGVLIADVNRVRLGAHLAPGTTVMHEGFCNFNAGTLGPSMVEGRISAGVIVGSDSDVGGSASIMGTLSGGGKEIVAIGARCLLGANSGTGISLGDDCVVEAGCYITAGSQIKLPDGGVVKARSLSGATGLLYRRNAQTGALEAIPRSGAWEGLNSALHAN